MQVLLCLPHLGEALPSNNIYGAAVIDEDPAHIVFGEVHGILANVDTDDEGVVVWVVLKPEVNFGKRDWDMGPRGAEVLSFAHM